MGMKCPSCGRKKASYENGALQCAGCGTMCWTTFDRPSAGKPRKGWTCFNCGGMTIHPVGKVADAEVWRCSTCGTTFVCPLTAAPAT